MFDQTLELQTQTPIVLTEKKPPARAERHVTQAELDATLEGSFPASDPPSWNAGIARPAPERQLEKESARRLLARVAALV